MLDLSVKVTHFPFVQVLQQYKALMEEPKFVPQQELCPAFKQFTALLDDCEEPAQDLFARFEVDCDKVTAESSCTGNCTWHAASNMCQYAPDVAEAILNFVCESCIAKISNALRVITGDSNCRAAFMIAYSKEDECQTRFFDGVWQLLASSPTLLDSVVNIVCGKKGDGQYCLKV